MLLDIPRGRELDFFRCWKLYGELDETRERYISRGIRMKKANYGRETGQRRAIIQKKSDKVVKI